MVSVSALTCLGDGIAQTAQIINNYCDRFEKQLKIPEDSTDSTIDWNNFCRNFQLKPSAAVLLTKIFRGAYYCSVSNLSPDFTFSIDFDVERFRNFAVFGFLDGAVSHSWFLLLDNFIKGDQFMDILSRIFADNMVLFTFITVS